MLIDEGYYQNQFKGKTLPETDIMNQLQTASYDVHYLTRNRTVDYEQLTPFQLDLVRRAICHQAEHNFTRQDVSGLAIDQISSDGESISYVKGESVRFSRLSRNLLSSAGLRYSGFN